MDKETIETFEGQAVSIIVVGAQRELRFVGTIHLLDDYTAEISHSERGRAVVQLERIVSINSLNCEAMP